MEEVTPEDEAAVRAFYGPLQRALRDLASGLGLRRRDLPHAKPILVAFGLEVFKTAFRMGHEAALLRSHQDRPTQRPTVRKPPPRHVGTSGVVAATGGAEGRWDVDAETPLVEPVREVDVSKAETTPGYRRKR